MLWLRRELAIVNKSSATQTAYAIYRAVIQSCLTACVRLCRYVAKLSMNSTANEFSGSWATCFAQLNFTAWKIRGTVTFCLIIIVSLAANSLIVRVVSKTPINYFIANMAISDLLFPVFLIPLNLSNLQNNYSWLIGGQLGQALCKLLPFFSNVSLVVSIQNLTLIAVDRFGAVVFPLRSPLIRSKLCPFFILTTWVVAIAVSSPYLFTYELVKYPEGTLVPFFGGVSTAVSSQNLILIAVDRFGSVVFPLRSPLIRSKLCSFFILTTWIVAVTVRSPDLFAAKIVESPEGTWCYEMGKSIRRVIVPCQFPTSLLHSVDIHPCDVFSHSLLHHSYQAQDIGTPR